MKLHVPTLRAAFRAWALEEGRAAHLVRFRMAFAFVWLTYDILDLLLEGTARTHDWLATTPPSGLVSLQTGLISCEVLLLLGRPAGLAQPAALLACVLRAVEWHEYVMLNDFAYYAVTALLVAQVAAPGGLLAMPGPDARTPRWPRDVLVLEAAWMYFATGLLKLNPSWLSGRHLFVRLSYLRLALGWPYPALLNRCIDALPCDAALAAGGVLGELALAALLVFVPRRRVVLPIALMIHGFAAVATNVWFFGPSLVLQVGLLTASEREWTRRRAHPRPARHV